MWSLASPLGGPLQFLVDDRLECFERLRACEEAAVDEDRRRRADTEPRARLQAGTDTVGVFARVETRAEGTRLEAQVRRMLFQCVHLQRPLVLEQPVVVLPVLALIA